MLLANNIFRLKHTFLFILRLLNELDLMWQESVFVDMC